MTLMTGIEYRESLRKLSPDVWVRGRRVQEVADEPLFTPGVNAIAATYEAARRQDMSEVALTTLESGEIVSRLVALDRSADDLLMKLELCRLLCRETGCAQRYLMHDALGAVAEVTAILDQRASENTYQSRFAQYLRYLQQEDLTCAVAMTDPKGDRGLRPHEQEDKDRYLHRVGNSRDGIIVRGAKANVTAAPYTHEIIVLPTRSMLEADKDFAVSFAIPVDAPGLRIVSRPAGRPGDREAPFSSRYGQATALVVFENVLVPWERVFLCGEWEFAGKLVEAFATHHRTSCIGCRAGLGDVIVGAAAETAKLNGLPAEKARNTREALIELLVLVETFFACGVAACRYGRSTIAGNWAPDALYANVGKLLMGRAIYDTFRVAHEISGGLVVTVPTIEDVESHDNAALIDKYMAAGTGTSAGERIALARLLQDITASTESGWYSVISTHGGGSPAATRLGAWRGYDLKVRRSLARKLACGSGGCGGCGASGALV